MAQLKIPRNLTLAANTPGAFGKGFDLVLFNYPGGCYCVGTCVAKGFSECSRGRKHLLLIVFLLVQFGRQFELKKILCYSP